MTIGGLPVPSILCLDTDIRSGQRLKDLFQAAGHSVTTAWSYWQGVRELRQHRFSFLITRETVRLPGDGRRLARILQTRRDCRILVLDRDIVSVPVRELLDFVDQAACHQPESETPPDAGAEKVA